MARPDEESPAPAPPSAVVRIQRVADEGQLGGGGTTSTPITTIPPVIVVQPPAPPVVVTPPSGSQQITITPPATVPVPPTSTNAEIARIVENLQTSINNKFTQIGDNLALINELLQGLIGRVATVEQRPAGQVLQGLQGPPGLNGTNGINGTNGTNGRDGANGSLFVSTPEFTKIDQRIDTALGKASIAQSSADVANAKNGAQDAAIASIRGAIAGLGQGGGVVAVPPSVAEIQLAVKTYLDLNPVPRGVDGKNGTNGKDGINADTSLFPSINTVKAWVDEAITSIDIPQLVARLIPAGTGGGTGTTTPGITIDEVKAAVAAQLQPINGLLSDAEAFVWGMILNANDEFWTMFLDRLDQIDFEKSLPQ